MSGMKIDEDEDRGEWDRAWSESPLRRLVTPVQIEVMPSSDPGWGKVVRVDIAADPVEYADDIGYRNTDGCPVCGDAVPSGHAIPATIHPYFEGGFSYGLPCWVHEACLESCEEVEGTAPVPW